MSRSCSLIILLALQAHSTQTPADERPFPARFDWGTLSTTPVAVELRVKSIPDDRVIRVPRFNNPYRRIYLQSDSKRSPLAFKPEVSEWLITLPDAATAPDTIVIETVGAPLLVSEPVMTEANSKEGAVMDVRQIRLIPIRS